MKIIDAANYAEFWRIESELFERQGVYEKLGKIAPPGKVLEVGAGVGLSTIALAASREVLALDSNAILVDQVQARIDESGVSARILLTDFLEPSEEVVRIIEEFSPQVIVGWFLGSNGDDQAKHVDRSVHIRKWSKAYRERIEDALVTAPLNQPSVEWVHLVYRAGRAESSLIEEVKSDCAKGYDEHVFHPNGFEVEDVQIFDWDREDSKFMYEAAPNPNFAGEGTEVPIITSVIARRRSTQ